MQKIKVFLTPRTIEVEDVELPLTTENVLRFVVPYDLRQIKTVNSLFQLKRLDILSELFEVESFRNKVDYLKVPNEVLHEISNYNLKTWRENRDKC